MIKNRLVILGGGESGTGAAILGVAKGYETFVSDLGVIQDLYKAELTARGIPFEELQHTPELILNADLVVKSPGIPDKAPIIKSLIHEGVQIISEIEFAGRYTNAKTICITGSNGKTTTTLLTYDLLRRAGLKVGLAGNIGKSFARQVAEDDYDYYVLEISSFQLDGMFDFHANIAILTNITPDHLDRYNYEMQNYTDSKFRIVQNQTDEDFFIYNDDDPVIEAELAKRSMPAMKLPFSLAHPLSTGGWLEGDKMKLNVYNNIFDMTILELALQGKHNVNNSMAAGISGMVLKLRKDDIRECLSDFQGVEHRLERFMRVHEIEFINDSKATNVNSVWYALESMSTKVIWLVGGIDKGNDYTQLYDLVREKVKAIVCIGVDNSKIKEAFKDFGIDIIETRTMEEAVRSSYFLSTKGDSVLLSPACASFDLFKNYEDRGRQFKEAVRNL
jgi:UDP-N-acetylmuramoylalanine--D-glutamate ligase